ncbi:hypothetical protein [Streptomyces sp. NPDC086023]|uniref:hypothetical protein n=1 Tax=Streptomyces sp. NPDC086023 TaxID=3365746 RepID=UPI0037D4B2E9
MGKGKWSRSILAGLVVLALAVGGVLYLVTRYASGPQGIERALAADPGPYPASLRVTVRDFDGEARITRAPEGCEISSERMLALCNVDRGREAETVAGFGARGTIRNHHKSCCWDQGDLSFSWAAGRGGVSPSGRIMSGDGRPHSTDWYVRPIKLGGSVGDKTMVELPQEYRGGQAPEEIWIQLPQGVSLVDVADNHVSEYNWCYEMREKPGWLSCGVHESVYPLYLSVRLDRKVEGAKGRVMVGHHPGDPDPSNDRAEVKVDIR